MTDATTEIVKTEIVKPEGAASKTDAVETGEPKTKRSQKTVWHYLCLGVSGGVLALVILLAVVTIVIPKFAGATSLAVLTGSMEPSLPPGTLIVIRPVNPAELAIGDVITYQIRSGDPALITHRIVAVDSSTTGDTTYVTKGDNNSDNDTDPVIDDQVRGRLWYAVPAVGYASAAIHGDSRQWITPLCAALLLCYSGYALTSGIVTTMRRSHGRPG